jgi:hypothetical protein
LSAGRRHLYIPDDLWRRLQSEAGATGVRERDRAYSASEFMCNLLRERLVPGEPKAREETEPARKIRSARQPAARGVLVPSGQPLGRESAGKEGASDAASAQHRKGKTSGDDPPSLARPFAPVTKEQQARRGRR